MRNATRTYQQGITLTGMLLTGIIIILLVILAVKLIPDAVEYQKIVANLNAIVQDPATKEISAEGIRAAYQRRASIDDISAVKPGDIQIAHSGNRVVLSFDYRRETHLFGPVSLVIDYRYRTSTKH
ncbi:MAG: DUF4845 domain-containing protein [Zoogloeaceae bacterium]|jgi:hypothetical protein|nr:DUF4845 domain-containing protein [Zoogloeaceae bacterium]